MSTYQNPSLDQNKQLVLEVLQQVATNPRDFEATWHSVSAQLSPEVFIETSLVIFKQEDVNLPANLKVFLSVFLKQLLKSWNSTLTTDTLRMNQNIYELIIASEDLRTKSLYAEAFIRLYSRLTIEQKEELIHKLVVEPLTLMQSGNCTPVGFNIILSNMLLLGMIFKETQKACDKQIANKVFELFGVELANSLPFAGFITYLVTLNQLNNKFINFYFDEFVLGLFECCGILREFESFLAQNLDMWVSAFGMVPQCGGFEVPVYLKLFEVIEALNRLFSKAVNYWFTQVFNERYAESLCNVVFGILAKGAVPQLEDKDSLRSMVFRMLTLVVSTVAGKAILKPRLPSLVKELILPCLAESEIERDNETDNPTEFVNYRFDCVDLRESKTVKTNAFLFLDAICENFTEFSLFLMKANIYIALLCLQESVEVSQSLSSLTYEDTYGNFFLSGNDRFQTFDLSLMVITSLSYLSNENPKIIALIDHLILSIMGFVETHNNNQQHAQTIRKVMSGVFLLFTFLSDVVLEGRPETFDGLLDYAFNYLNSRSEQDVLNVQIILTLHKVIDEDRIIEYMTNRGANALSVIVAKVTQFNMPELYEIVQSLIDNLELAASEQLLLQIMKSISYCLRVPEAYIQKLLDLCCLLIVKSGKMSTQVSESLSLFMQDLILSNFISKKAIHTKEVFKLLCAYFENGNSVQTVALSYFRQMKDFLKSLNTAPLEQARITLFLLRKFPSMFLSEKMYITQIAQILIVNLYSADPNERLGSLMILSHLYAERMLDSKDSNDHITLLLTDLFPSLVVDTETLMRLDCINQLAIADVELFLAKLTVLRMSLLEYVKRATFVYLSSHACSKYHIGHFAYLLINILNSGSLDTDTTRMYTSLVVLLLNYNFKRQHEMYIEEKSDIEFKIRSLVNLSGIHVPVVEDGNYLDGGLHHAAAGGEDDAEDQDEEEGDEKSFGTGGDFKQEILRVYEEGYNKNERLFISEYNLFTSFFRNLVLCSGDPALLSVLEQQLGKHIKELRYIRYRQVSGRYDCPLRKIVRFRRN